MSEETKDFWAGDFGNQYLKRNRVDWRARIPFWGYVLDLTGARSVFEVGTNAGWNLSAIRRVYSDVAVYGCDMNSTAAEQAVVSGLNVAWLPADDALLKYRNGFIELVFTAGVLIHIAPNDIKRTMQAIIDASSQYVLAVEYASDQEEEVEYRGHTGKLWRRPYGKLYQDMGLTLVKEWDAGVGFDRCTAWLLRR